MAETPSEPTAPHPPPPIEKLDRETLSYLVEVCVGRKEILTAFKELGVHAPGYRLDKMSHADLAVMYAEEALAADDALTRLRGEIGKALGGPSFMGVLLTAPVVKEMLVTLREDPLGEAARLCWRLLLDTDPAVAALATEAAAVAIDWVDAYAKEAEGAAAQKTQAVPKPDEAVRRAEELARTVERAQADAERQRELLRETRAQLADVERRLGEEKRVVEVSREEMLAAREEAARLREAGADKGLAAQAEARKLRDENQALRDRLSAAERARDEVEEHLTAAQAELAEAREQAPKAPLSSEHPEMVEAVVGGVAGGDATDDWVIPNFSREFYDSIRGWDRRLQRAAFDKAMLLARDRRHPSLRAIALEGAPGYYRIRVATDVRLIYRVGDRGSVEILSLIDREDLDRYVKQAKTRPSS